MRGRVLVVDDESAVAQYVRAALASRLGCDVEVAADGAAAVEALARAPFAAIVSDVRMPQMNGLELHDWVRSHQPAMTPRMIFTTGDAGGSELNTALERRECRILRKPFTLDALVACVREIGGLPLTPASC
jgi:CheY-like chemotaxis protein